MKALLTPAMLAVAALMLGAILVLTCTQPPAAANIPTSQPSVFTNSSLPIDLGKPPTSPSPFQPGADQFTFPSPNTLPKDQIFAPSKPTPLLALRQPDHQPLQPGVYQTYPYTIILVVPGRGIDDRILANAPNTNSPMPIITPHVEVVPKS
jgi:hypothetical protein